MQRQATRSSGRPDGRRGKRDARRTGRVAGSWALSLLALALLGIGPPRCGLVQITAPESGAVVLATEVSVDVSLWPPLAPRERIEVRLRAGLDAIGGVELRDLSDRLVLARDRRSARLVAGPLPPGRSELVVVRRRGGSEPDPSPPHARTGGPAPRSRLAGSFDGLFDGLRTTRLVLDRGGFEPDAPPPWNAGAVTSAFEHAGALGLRRLDVVVWYPTDADSPARDLQLDAIPGAPPVAGARALPTLLFSHGNCGEPHQSTYLTAGLARVGFLVAAMSHPGNTSENPADCDDPSKLVVAFAERPGDVIATLDWLIAETGSPASPLHDLVDPDRLGLAGWSFGGQTAIRVPAEDDRFRAALALAPSYAPVRLFIDPSLPLAIPVMVQGASLDETTPFEVDQRPLFERLVAPRYLVEIFGTGHFAFGDAPCASCGADVLPQERAHALAQRFGFAFLGRYVAGDRRWENLLAPASGASFTADP